MRKLLSRALIAYMVSERVSVILNKRIVLGCGILFFLYMLLIVSDVFGRFVLNRPIPGIVAIGENVLAFGIFLGWAYALICRRHISVTALTERLPQTVVRRLELFSSLCGFLLTFLIASQSLPFALDSLRTGEMALDYNIPRYYGKFAYFVGSSMFCLQFFLQFVKILISGSETSRKGARE